MARLRDAGITVPVLVGGRGVPSAGHARATGADGWTGVDGASAVQAFLDAVAATAPPARQSGARTQ